MVPIADRDPLPRGAAAFLLGTEATRGTLPSLLEALTRALRDLDGIPVARASISIPLMHPELRSAQVIWSDDAGARELLRGASKDTTALYDRSPMRPLYDGTTRQIRHRLRDDDPSPRAYEILDELHAKGFTDYLALCADAPTHWERAPMTWATRTPGGFSDAQVAALQALVPLLSLVLGVHGHRRKTRTLLRTYLGDDAASRVLDGHIRRGDVVDVEAAVCFCDLRNFTALSQELSRPDLLALLDDAFDAVVGAVEEQQGDVLKFIGDAVLAVFRAEDNDESRRDVAHRAWTAATNALQRARDTDARRRAAGHAPLSIGLSVHMGRIAYGNIGGPTRLDFTVIGPAVNLASRLEGMCRPLGASVVVSDAVARHLPAERFGDGGLVDTGEHALKGIPAPVRIYASRG
ncbi:MAG: hypothetical protein RLZZ299_920 [Pseudomonadota bacterium]|jgi:adenylate cyclase